MDVTCLQLVKLLDDSSAYLLAPYRASDPNDAACTLFWAACRTPISQNMTMQAKTALSDLALGLSMNVIRNYGIYLPFVPAVSAATLAQVQGSLVSTYSIDRGNFDRAAEYMDPARRYLASEDLVFQQAIDCSPAVSLNVVHHTRRLGWRNFVLIAGGQTAVLDIPNNVVKITVHLNRPASFMVAGAAGAPIVKTANVPGDAEWEDGAGVAYMLPAGVSTLYDARRIRVINNGGAGTHHVAYVFLTGIEQTVNNPNGLATMPEYNYVRSVIVVFASATNFLR